MSPPVKVRVAWDRLHGEPQDAYRRFSAWLRQSERELPLEDLELAQRWRWTERADAFDEASKVDELTADQQRALFGRLTPAVMLHAIKRYAERLAKPGAEVSAKDLQILQEIDRTAQGITPGTPTIDVSKLSREDRDAYLRAKELERKLLKEGSEE